MDFAFVMGIFMKEIAEKLPCSRREKHPKEYETCLLNFRIFLDGHCLFEERLTPFCGLMLVGDSQKNDFSIRIEKNYETMLHYNSWIEVT